LNVTVPVGVGVPEAGLTVAVSVTLVPTATEVPEALSVVVVGVGAGGATATPVPVKVTACGLPVALSAKVRVAVSAAAVLGSNVTLTVQVFPAATVALVQVSAPMWKSAMSVPPGVTVVMSRFEVPVFVMVRVRALLVVPWFWFPKASGLGEAENAGPEGPAPPLITNTLLVMGTKKSSVAVFTTPGVNPDATIPTPSPGSFTTVSTLVAPLMITTVPDSTNI
jgi:hypothetical protein